MVVRIRFRRGPRPAQRRRKHRQIALLFAALLSPVALMASALGAWRIAADLKWTNRFAIPTGIFSHWQVWLGGAILLQLCSRVLNRYGRGSDEATS